MSALREGAQRFGAHCRQGVVNDVVNRQRDQLGIFFALLRDGPSLDAAARRFSADHRVVLQRSEINRAAKTPGVLAARRQWQRRRRRSLESSSCKTIVWPTRKR